MKLDVVSDHSRGRGETLEHSICDTVLSEIAPTARDHIINNGFHKVPIFGRSVTTLDMWKTNYTSIGVGTWNMGGIVIELLIIHDHTAS